MPRAAQNCMDEYMSELDVIGQFFDKLTTTETHARVNRTALFNAFKVWASDNAPDTKMTGSAFYTSVEKKGYRQTKSCGTRYFEGLTLKEY